MDHSFHFQAIIYPGRTPPAKFLWSQDLTRANLNSLYFIFSAQQECDPLKVNCKHSTEDFAANCPDSY